MLVGDAPNAVRNARRLLYGDDDPGSVDHNVVVQTEAGWLGELEKELPFPRNVEAEGVQIAPDPHAVAWINPYLQPREERRVMTGIPAKTGRSSRPWTARPASSCRPTRPSPQT